MKKMWMKAVMKRVRMKREKELKKEEKMTDWQYMMMEMNQTNEESWKRILIEMNAGNRENTEELCRVLMKNEDENAKQTSKVIKTAKVPAWSKDMSLEVFEKQIKVWNDINGDVSEYSRYQI